MNGEDVVELLLRASNHSRGKAADEPVTAAAPWAAHGRGGESETGGSRGRRPSVANAMFQHWRSRNAPDAAAPPPRAPLRRSPPPPPLPSPPRQAGLPPQPRSPPGSPRNSPVPPAGTPPGSGESRVSSCFSIVSPATPAARRARPAAQRPAAGQTILSPADHTAAATSPALRSRFVAVPPAQLFSPEEQRPRGASILLPPPSADQPREGGAPAPGEERPSVNPCVCSACLAIPDRAVVLPCGHHICAGCVPGSSDRGTVWCQSCSSRHRRADVAAGGGGEAAGAAAPVAGNSADLCGRCLAHRPDLVCCDCAAYYCSACAALVHVGALKTSHVLERLDVAPGPVPQTVGLGGRCPQKGHTAHKLDFFDLDEGRLLCLMCVSENHVHTRDHACLAVPDAVRHVKHELLAADEAARDFADFVKSAVRLVQSGLRKVGTLRDEGKAGVRAVFEEWHAALREREAAIEDRVDRFYEQQTKALETALGKQLALLSAFNKTSARLQRVLEANHLSSTTLDESIHGRSLAPDEHADRKLLLTSRTLSLEEVFGLLDTPLPIPAVAQLDLQVTEPDWSRVTLASAAKNLDPPQTLRFGCDPLDAAQTAAGSQRDGPRGGGGDDSVVEELSFASRRYEDERSLCDVSLPALRSMRPAWTGT